MENCDNFLLVQLLAQPVLGSGCSRQFVVIFQKEVVENSDPETEASYDK